MLNNLTILDHPPEEVTPKAAVKYYVHAREKSERTVLTVVHETPTSVYGFVKKSARKGSIGKVWMLKRGKLENLLLNAGFGCQWEVSMKSAA